MDTIHINNAWDCVNSKFFFSFSEWSILLLTNFDLGREFHPFTRDFSQSKPQMLSNRPQWRMQSRPHEEQTDQSRDLTEQIDRECNMTNTIFFLKTVVGALACGMCAGSIQTVEFTEPRKIKLMGRCRTCNWSSSIGAYGLIAHANQIKSYHIDSFFFLMFLGPVVSYSTRWPSCENHPLPFKVRSIHHLSASAAITSLLGSIGAMLITEKIANWKM